MGRLVMGVTTAFIWFQIAIMILFAKEFLPQDMSHIWKNMFKKRKKPHIMTDEERHEWQKRASAERFARKQLLRKLGHDDYNEM